MDEDFGIELHGNFSPQPVHDLVGNEPDLFSLMISRASMLGWSSPASALKHRPRLWHPASAEVEHLDDTGDSCLWAQIIQEEVPAAASALVVQPVARCLADCVDKLGHLRLTEVHISAVVGDPVNVAEIYGEQWFSDTDPWLSAMFALELVPATEGADAGSPGIDIGATVTTANELIQIVADTLGRMPSLRTQLSGQELHFQVPQWSVEVSGWLMALVLAALSNSGLPAEQRVRLHLRNPET